MFKRLIDAVPEVKFELYSFKSTIKCKEMLEQDCWFENKVRAVLQLQAPFTFDKLSLKRILPNIMHFSVSSKDNIEVIKYLIKFYILSSGITRSCVEP